MELTNNNVKKVCWNSKNLLSSSRDECIYMTCDLRVVNV